MDNETVTIYPRQEGISFSVTVPKIVAERAAEIAKQNPEKWMDNDLSLLNQATAELQQEGKLPKTK